MLPLYNMNNSLTWCYILGEASHTHVIVYLVSLDVNRGMHMIH